MHDFLDWTIIAGNPGKTWFHERRLPLLESVASQIIIKENRIIGSERFMVFSKDQSNNKSILISGLGGKEGAVQRCPNCRGTGMQVRVQQLGPGMMQQIQSVCGECHGSGERIDPKLRCKKCSGKKVTRERKILEVVVDKGMEDGQKITFGSEGDQEPGMEPGDIIIVLDEKEHPTFKRNGVDLIMKFNINITEALCGFKKAIKTLDDRNLIIQTIPG